MAENYNTLQKDDETIRLTILSNICRMMINRGHIDINKHLYIEGKNAQQKIERYMKSDPIDNDSFLQYIEEYSSGGIYTIPMDVHFKDDALRTAEMDGNGDSNKDSKTSDFDGSKLIIKIMPKKITDIHNSPEIDDFLHTYAKFHKIMVFDGITEKAHTSIRKKNNLEAFDRDYLMIDMMLLVYAPISVQIINREQIKHIVNPSIEKIMENDALARYYNAKKGDILRIVRASINNSVEYAYRKVIDPKPVFKS